MNLFKRLLICLSFQIIDFFISLTFKMQSIPDEIYSIIISYMTNCYNFSITCKKCNRVIRKYSKPSEKIIKNCYKFSKRKLAGILQCEQADFSKYYKTILKKCFDFDSKTLIKLLISHKNINPSDRDNEILILASENGYYEIVKLLLSDNRIDPTHQKNKALRTAVLHERYNIVKLLLSDPRIDPSDFDNEALSSAIFKNNYDIVKLLLSYSKVNESKFKNNMVKDLFQKIKS